MDVEYVPASGTTLAIYRAGNQEKSSVELIWGHGWGQSGADLLPLADALAPYFPSAVLDFPGFGESPAPPLTWGTADYADAVAAWFATLPPRRRIWVGHSFGCRVALQLASRHPELLAGMVLVAAAGLRRRRRATQRIKLALRIRLFKMGRSLIPEGPRRERWIARFGSTDYQSAGVLRSILTRVINEDLSDVAKGVRCPALLIYGKNDQDTPPEIGERLASLIPKARLLVLDGFDHHSILVQGRHQVLQQIRSFVEGNSR